MGLVTFACTNSLAIEIYKIEADSIEEKDQKKNLGEYLIVVGSFSDEMEAIYYFNELCNKDVPAFFYYDKPKGMFYVHVGRYYFEQDAKSELKKNPYPQLSKSIKKVKAYPQQ
jgi:hypothetical protein